MALPFSDRDQITIDLLLLIKVLVTFLGSVFHTKLQHDSVQAVALFNASRHDEAMRRVQDLTIAYRHSDTYLCSVVNVSFMQTSFVFSLSDALVRCIYICSLQWLLSRMGSTTKLLVASMIAFSAKPTYSPAKHFLNLD